MRELSARVQALSDAMDAYEAADDAVKAAHANKSKVKAEVGALIGIERAGWMSDDKLITALTRAVVAAQRDEGVLDAPPATTKGESERG